MDWTKFDVEYTAACVADYLMIVESEDDEDDGNIGDTQIGTFEKLCGHFGENHTM